MMKFGSPSMMSTARFSRTASSRELGAGGLLPSSNVRSLGLASIEVRALVLAFPQLRLLAARPHPDPGKEGEQADGAEAALGFRQEDGDDHGHSARPGALRLALVKQADQLSKDLVR